MPPSHPQAVTDVSPSLEFRSWGRSPGARPDLMARSCLGGTLLPGCGAGPPAGPMGAAAPRTRCGAPQLHTGCGGQAVGRDPSPPAHPREQDPGPAPRSADAPAQPYMVRAQSSPTQRGPPRAAPHGADPRQPQPRAVRCCAVWSCVVPCGAVELSSAGAPQSRGRFPSARLVPLSPRLDSSSSPGAAGNSCADGPPSSPFPSLLFPSRPPRSPPRAQSSLADGARGALAPTAHPGAASGHIHVLGTGWEPSQNHGAWGWVPVSPCPWGLPAVTLEAEAAAPKHGVGFYIPQATGTGRCAPAPGDTLLRPQNHGQEPSQARAVPRRSVSR